MKHNALVRSGHGCGEQTTESQKRRRNNMKTNDKHEVVARIGRRGLALAAFFAMALYAAGIGRAQSNATPATAPLDKLGPAPAKAPVPPDPEKPKKGSHEGIIVHGHWTLEVKNPDGTVVERREFENALDPFEGADLLTGVLSGEYTPLGFYVDLLNLASFSGLCEGSGYCIFYDTRSSICNMCGGALTYTANRGGP